jgi:acetylornithine/N-succinyldiaminopimelate aminotransferase
MPNAASSDAALIDTTRIATAILTVSYPAGTGSLRMSHVMPTYGRADVAFERGEGPYLISTEGRRYLDFASGIAVTSLGHAHPVVVKALTEQAQKVWHTSNLFKIPGQERLAERLCAASFADLVFFCNSGAEALEGVIKTVRKYQYESGKPERYRIITFEGAFHGRTLATLAAAGNEKYLKGFGPKVDGFDQVPLNDLAAVKKAITKETAGILIEPIQGEGGIRASTPEFLKGLRQLCDEHGLLLAFDEVQCGMGRTGKLFAYEWYGVKPDVMGLAKSVGAGFPFGCFMATKEAAKGMVAGAHGSTYGGNPLAMAVGNAVLDVILAPGFLDNALKVGSHLKQQLAMLVDKHPKVLKGVRGMGLMLGLEAVVENTKLVDAAREEGLLTVGAGENVVRIAAPLIISDAQVKEGIDALDRACSKLA